MIWNFSLEPRIVRIKPASYHNTKDMRGVASLPVISSSHVQCSPPKTRFNGSLDTLFFREDDLAGETTTFFQRLTSNEAGRICYLAFDGEFIDRGVCDWSYRDEGWLIKHMTNLERMVIVMDSWHSQTWEIVEGCKDCGKSNGCLEDADGYCGDMWAWHDIFKWFPDVPRRKVFYGTVGEPDEPDWHDSSLDSDSDSKLNSDSFSSETPTAREC
ncbi:hypothetical protein BDZ45DRAFT_742333 [Acephala macrosclerotiorum]|nr:hypothetical protein BDZ45DRAFT_742333 [Acephala macrosclerotiorum]